MATGGFLSPLIGGTGAMGSAANQTWQNGQFMPYNLALPGANMNFNGNMATGSLSGGLGQMYGGVGNFGASLLNNGSLNYNPTAGSYLGGQFNSIYGTNPTSTANINGAANTQFQNLMSAEQPWLAQQRAQNLDSEMAKGTLASTAGSYQTAGLDQAQNSLMSQNANTAYQQALQQAGLQQSQQAASFGAASNVANLQEQESQFKPQLATGQLNSAFGNLNSTNSSLAQELGLGGNLGGLRSNANVNALNPNFQAGAAGLMGQSGFLNSLLFGGGQGGGLLQSLLGGGSGSNGSGGTGLLGGLAAKGIGALSNYLFGGGGGGSGATDAFSNLGDMSNTDPGIWSDSSIFGGGFNGASGQAANGIGDSLGGQAATSAPSAASDVSGYLGDLGAGTGIYSGIKQGGVQGYGKAALDGYKLASNLGLLPATGLAAYGTGAAADAAVTGALGSVGAQTAGTSAAIAASNAAALGGSGSAAAGAGASAGGAASSGVGAGALGAAGALAGAALPLALAALVPYNSGFSNSEVQGMLNDISAATKANGGKPISAGYDLNPDGSINQAKSQQLNDLYTLLGDNSDEFTKAGGQGWIDQQLTNLGYGNLVNGRPGAITTPSPGGQGWLGGSSRGKVRV